MGPTLFPNDNMMSEAMRTEWGWDGRNDLGFIRQLNMNSLRLYSSSPAVNATSFLDTANSWGLKVLPNIPDSSFLQPSAEHMPCGLQGFDCFSKLKDVYTDYLKNGFVTNGTYHPAIDTVILANEPDLKFLSADMSKNGKEYMKSLVSAFDGVLVAEQDVGVDVLRSKVRWAIPFSYQTWANSLQFKKLHDDDNFGCCTHDPNAPEHVQCSRSRPDYMDDCPSLALIIDFAEALADPENAVGYKVKVKLPEDLTIYDVYQKRFLNSVNTPVQFAAFEKQFLVKYDRYQQIRASRGDETIMVFAGEYFDPSLKTPKLFHDDFMAAVNAVRHHHPETFLGFILRQFQVSYTVSCNELMWAKFLTETAENKSPQNPCRIRDFGMFALGSYPIGRTGVIKSKYGGSAQQFDVTCVEPASWDESDGKVIAIAEILHGKVADITCPKGDNLVLHCVSDRGASAESVHLKIKEVCNDQLHGIKCGETTPQACQNDVYGQADWAFSISAVMNGHESCDAQTGVLTPIPSRPECVVLPSSVQTGPDITTEPPQSTPASMTTSPAPLTTTPSSQPNVYADDADCIEKEKEYYWSLYLSLVLSVIAVALCASAHNTHHEEEQPVRDSIISEVEMS